MAYALFTDLDNTLYGNTLATQRSTTAVLRWLKQHDLPVFAVTGRSFEMIADPSPFTGLACEVGTQLYLKTTSGSFQLDKAYNRYVKKNSDFDYRAIQRLCTCLAIKHAVQFQPLKQKYKISLHFTGSIAYSLKIQRLFQRKFIQENFSKVQVILSTAQPKHYCLDVLAVGKETAVAYLVKKYRYQPIVAGDSGNDIIMLLKTPWPAIIVGGYTSELKQALHQQRQIIRTKKIYIESTQRRGPTSLLYGLKTLLSNYERKAQSINKRYSRYR